jgi:hypothetical protein
MKQTKPGFAWSFAAYPWCSPDCGVAAQRTRPGRSSLHARDAAELVGSRLRALGLPADSPRGTAWVARHGACRSG